jgi:hypothetical protein
MENTSDLLSPTTVVTLGISVLLLSFVTYFIWTDKMTIQTEMSKQIQTLRDRKDGDERLDLHFENMCFEDTQVIDPFLDLTGRWRIAETGEFIVSTRPNISGVFEFVIGSPYIPARSLRGPFVGYIHKENPRQVHIYAANLEWRGEIINQDHIVFVDPNKKIRTWVRQSVSPLPENP